MWISVLVITLDVFSKYWVRINFFSDKNSFFVFSFMNICYLYNSGLMLGLFSSILENYRKEFIFFILLIVVYFLTKLHKLNKKSKYYYINACSYSLIIGGALGNLYDRIVYGKVIDFIDLHIGHWHWPAFNVADLGVFFGLILIFLSQYSLVKNN